MNDLSRLTLRRLSDNALHQATLEKAQLEQKTTLELLHHLHEVNRRRVFARFGYSSLWEYTHRYLGYSERATSERVSAMRLIFSVPEAKEKLEKGELSFTTAAKVQSFFRQREKLEHAPLTQEEKTAIVKDVAGKSVREVEKIFAEKCPATQFREKEKILTPELTSLQFLANEKLLKLIDRFKELKGQVGYAEIFEKALELYLEAEDPMRKLKAARLPTSEMKNSVQSSNPGSVLKSTTRSTRYITRAVQTKIWNRSRGQCEYVDPTTRRRCSSRTKLQLDHQKPFALGGSSASENLRHFCPTHNQYAAIQVFGLAKMSAYFKAGCMI